MLHLLQKIHQRNMAWLVKYLYVRGGLKVSGSLKDLAKNKPVMVVANHIHKMDPLVVMAFLPDDALSKSLPVKFMTYNTHYFTWLRPFLTLNGCFPSHDNRQGIPYGIDAAVQYLNQDYAFFIFPEGKRTREPLPAKRGVYEIAEKVPDIQLVMVRIDRAINAPAYRMHYELHQIDEYKNAQEILDTIYAMPLPD